MNTETELSKKNITRMSNSESNKITRECLRTALISLMTLKNFSEISVSELVKKAGVSRTSFYRNYEEKEDIILEIESNILSTYVDSLLSAEYNNNIYKWFYDIFNKIKDNAASFSIIDDAGMSPTIFDNAPKILSEHLDVTSTDELYMLIAIFGGLKDIMLHWFRSGMKESCEYMAQICTTLFDPIYKAAAEKIR